MLSTLIPELSSEVNSVEHAARVQAALEVAVAHLQRLNSVCIGRMLEVSTGSDETSERAFYRAALSVPFFSLQLAVIRRLSMGIAPQFSDFLALADAAQKAFSF
jgi:hypothetical protein